MMKMKNDPDRLDPQETRAIQHCIGNLPPSTDHREYCWDTINHEVTLHIIQLLLFISTFYYEEHKNKKDKNWCNVILADN